jgi:hypothetical protein
VQERESTTSPTPPLVKNYGNLTIPDILVNILLPEGQVVSDSRYLRATNKMGQTIHLETGPEISWHFKARPTPTLRNMRHDIRLDMQQDSSEKCVCCLAEETKEQLDRHISATF